MTHIIAANPSSLTISPPQWVEKHYGSRHKPWKHRVCYVGGLANDLCNYGRGGPVPIDASIVHIIVELNRLGYTTSFCCSGLPEDHVGGMGSQSGYLLFADGCELPVDVAPTGTQITWDNTHWAFAPNPDLAREQWGELAARLGVELDLSSSPRPREKTLWTGAA